MAQTKCNTCTIDYDWDLEYCIDGDVYGYCEYEGCSGACELIGECGCTCHDK